MTNKKEIGFLQDLNKLIKKHNVELTSHFHVDFGSVKCWIEVSGDIDIYFDDNVSSEIIENKIYMLGDD